MSAQCPQQGSEAAPEEASPSFGLALYAKSPRKVYLTQCSVEIGEVPSKALPTRRIRHVTCHRRMRNALKKQPRIQSGLPARRARLLSIALVLDRELPFKAILSGVISP